MWPLLISLLPDCKKSASLATATYYLHAARAPPGGRYIFHSIFTGLSSLLDCHCATAPLAAPETTGCPAALSEILRPSVIPPINAFQLINYPGFTDGFKANTLLPLLVSLSPYLFPRSPSLSVLERNSQKRLAVNYSAACVDEAVYTAGQGGRNRRRAGNWQSLKTAAWNWIGSACRHCGSHQKKNTIT